jgi:uncharacterized protein
MDAVTIALPLAGLVGGAVLGYVARRNYFCTLSALEQHWYGGNSDGLRTWVLAAALAATMVQLLSLSGFVDVSQSIYLTPQFNWLGAIVGGLAFGIGMALVGTCGFGALVRLGGGSLKSLIALLVLALFAISTARGLIAFGRVGIVESFRIDFEFAGSQSLPSVLNAILGFNLGTLLAVAALCVVFWWVFSDPGYRRRTSDLVTASVIAGVVAFGWFTTGSAAARSFEAIQVESASFVMPVGDTLLMFVLALGNSPDYGIGMVVGTVLGAAVAARSSDDVRWEACDDARELSRHLIGAAFMGTGGVLALGCTIGQGVSAMSTLAISAPVAMLSIAAGARIGLAWLLEGSFFAALR